MLIPGVKGDVSKEKDESDFGSGKTNAEVNTVSNNTCQSKVCVDANETEVIGDKEKNPISIQVMTNLQPYQLRSWIRRKMFWELF